MSVVNDSRDVLSTLLSHIQGCRSVGSLLSLDAALRSHEGDHDGTLDASRAVLNSGRSIGDEPTVISQVVRMALRLV